MNSKIKWEEFKDILVFKKELDNYTFSDNVFVQRLYTIVSDHFDTSEIKKCIELSGNFE